MAIASLEVLLIALYLGNHQCQFLFGYSDHPEKLFQSPPWRVLALLPFYLVTKWGDRVGVNISGCTWSPNPSFHYSTPYPTSCAECLTQRLIFYIIFSENVSSDMYLLPGWKRSNRSALWSRCLVWGIQLFLERSSTDPLYFSSCFPLFHTSSNATRAFWEFCGINWIGLGFLHCQFKIQSATCQLLKFCYYCLL